MMFGGANDDIANSIVQYTTTTAENSDALIITGYTESYGAGGYDVLLVKFSMFGGVLWNKAIGGVHEDIGSSIVQTIDKNFAITGYTKSYGAGGSDIWIIEIDSLGNVLWNRTFGGLDGDSGHAIIQMSGSNTNLAVAGYIGPYAILLIVDDCKAGTFINSSECVECPSGTYSATANSMECTPCSAGTYNSNTGQSACLPCSSGTYNPSTGGISNSSCRPCPINTHNILFGASECLQCPKWKFTMSVGSLNCIYCPAGMYVDTAGYDNLTLCLPCFEDTFSNSTNSSNCFPCPFGTTTEDNTGATECIPRIRNQSWWWLWLLISVAIVALIALIAYFVYNSRPQKDSASQQSSSTDLPVIPSSSAGSAIPSDPAMSSRPLSGAVPPEAAPQSEAPQSEAPQPETPSQPELSLDSKQNDGKCLMLSISENRV